MTTAEAPAEATEAACEHVPQSVRDALKAARAARDEGIAAAENADVLGWDRHLIDQAIDAFADTGEPFSANDLRDLLPDVRSALMGARFLAASCRRRIRRVGRTPSTKENTHFKPIDLWIGIDNSDTTTS